MRSRVRGCMKNFFDKGNPFVSKEKNKGDEVNTMSDEIKENEIVEETVQEENAETAQETSEEEVIKEEAEAGAEADKLKIDFENLNNQYLRLAADFDNYRKRQEQERENLLKFGTENALKKMLEVLDNFERGEKALEKVEDCQQVKDSFNLVHKQVLETLHKLGLEEIDAEGKEFDPNFHEAVMQTPTSEHPEHTIINVMQKGYKVGDKVLRPALVNVATEE